MAAPQRPLGTRAATIRRCLLATSVVHDLDLSWDDAEIAELGWPTIRLAGTPAVEMPAARVAEVLDGVDLESPVAVARLARWLLLRRTLAGLPRELVTEGLRVVGMPVGHVLHPGPDWVLAQVPGGCLDLGLGLLPDVAPGCMPTDRGRTGELFASRPPSVEAEPPVPLPVGLLAEAGIDAGEVWPAALARLEQLGALAADRRRRRPRDPLRPLAEADVVTLLASRRLRFALADEDPAGMVALVVPMSRRGWVSTAAIDPAFGPAAAAATDEVDRGFPRPLLLTEYEVVQVPAGGHPLRHLDQRTASR
jgi:hypothetical protein